MAFEIVGMSYDFVMSEVFALSRKLRLVVEVFTFDDGKLQCHSNNLNTGNNKVSGRVSA